MKDPIDFHIRSLEQRIDDLTEEVAALTEENEKQKAMLENAMGCFEGIHNAGLIDCSQIVAGIYSLLHSDQPKS